MLVDTGTRMSDAASKPAAAASRDTQIQTASDPAELDSSMTMSMASSTTTGSGRSEDLELDIDSFHVMSLDSLNDDEMSRSTHVQIKTVIDVSEMLTSMDSSGSKVTLYRIEVQSNDISFHFPSSCVWRSYSDFIWLRKRLAASCSFTKRAIPELPSRNLLNLFDRDFDIRRKTGLQEFLRKVVNDRSFLSDAALHLFLQSNLMVEKIQEWLDNKMEDSVFELIRRGKDLVVQNDNDTSQTEEEKVSQSQEDDMSRTNVDSPSSHIHVADA